MKIVILLYKNEMLPSLQEQRQSCLMYLNKIEKTDIKEIIIDRNDFNSYTKNLIDKDTSFIVCYNSFVLDKNYSSLMKTISNLLKMKKAIAFTNNKTLIVKKQHEDTINLIMSIENEIRKYSSKYGLLKTKNSGKKLGRNARTYKNIYVLDEMLKVSDKIKDMRKSKCSLKEISIALNFKYGTFIRYFYANRDMFE